MLLSKPQHVHCKGLILIDFTLNTQQELAEFWGTSTKTVSTVLAKVGLDISAGGRAVTQAYIESLQAQAARWQTGDLVAVRTRVEEAKARLLELELAEKAGTLVNVGELEAAYIRMVQAFAVELTRGVDDLADQLEALYGHQFDRELLHQHARQALTTLSTYNPDTDGFAAPTGEAGPHDDGQDVEPQD